MQELTAISLRSAAAAALQAARAASTHPQLQQQPSYPVRALASATSGLAPGFLPKGNSLLTDHTQQQQHVESPSASAHDVRADVGHASYALGQVEARSSKHSVANEVEQLSNTLAAQQQQQQLSHEGPKLPWNNDDQADTSHLQQQQQQSGEVPESGIQFSDAGGSAEGGVEGAGGGQDAAAKAAYRQWSASFEARMVSCAPCLPAHLLTCLVSLPQNTAPML